MTHPADPNGAGFNPEDRLFVLGTGHTVASVQVREQLHLDADRIRGALEALTGPDRLLRESLLVSTCARTEVYGVAHDPAHAAAVLRRLAGRETGAAPAVVERFSYLKTGGAAVVHALRVASGLESAVQGEAQILGQMRTSAGDEASGRTSGPLLKRLFQSAFTTGKRVRTETEIGRGAASLAGAAIQLLQARRGDLSDLSFLVLGAGDTGALVARLLRKAGATHLTVANRTLARAHTVAREVGGTARALSDLDALLPVADVVVGAVSSTRRLVDAARLRRAVGSDPIPAQTYLDLAHPRNFDPDLAALDDVDVMDLETLHRKVDTARAARSAQVPLAEAIVADETAAYLGWVRSRAAVPVVRAVRERVLALAREEAGKHARGLDDGQRQSLERFADSLARTLLHQPTSILRTADASTVEGQALLLSAGALFGVTDTAAPHTVPS